VVDDKTILPDDPAPTQTEALARRLLALLPGAEVTRGRYVFELGHDVESEDGVVVLLTAEAVEFRLPTVEWTAGTHAPVASSRLWRRIEGLDLIDLSDEQLEELLEAAKQARADEWATCRYCGERVPVEHRLGANVCHGCASRHEGVVF
jgi:hypothetical protein